MTQPAYAETILVAVTVLAALRLLFSRLYLAPSAVFGQIITMQSVVFYAVAYLRIYPSIIKGFHVKQNFHHTGIYVFAFYCAIVLVCLFMTIYIDRKFASTAQVSSDGKPIVDAVISDYLSSPYMCLLLLFILSFLVVHASQVNFDLLLHHRGLYTEPRQPLFFQIYNPVLGLFHRVIPLLGCFLSIVLVFYLRKRSGFFLLVTSIIFLYCFFVTCCFLSRFAAAQIFLIAIVLHRTKSKKISYAAVLTGLFGFVVYSAIIGLRIAVIGNFGNFGFGPLLNFFNFASVFSWQIFMFLFINLFGGGFLLASVFARSNFFYPLKYKLLSFSPLVSALDGFTSVESYADLNRFPFAPTSPFSNFVEAYIFGIAFFVFFLLLIFLILYSTTKFWVRYPSVFSILIMGPMYFGFLKMHSYTLRGTVRLFYLSFALSFVLGRICEKIGKIRLADPKKKTGAPGLVEVPEF